MSRQIVVIAPHPDDEAIGCGGTIRLHRQRGDRVTVVFLTSGERGIKGVPIARAAAIREQEARRATTVFGCETPVFLRLPDLGLAQSVKASAGALRPMLKRLAPAMIYLPHPQDRHPDHEACLAIVRRALSGRRAPSSIELRAYEVWTPMSVYEWPEDISRVMVVKLRAIRCYGSQLAAFRFDLAAKGLNQFRGALAVRCRYAEVFRSLSPGSGT